jgi:hypothetical protein
MSARVAVVVAAALLWACGVKGLPTAPELVRPNAPTEIIARSGPDGVRLTWERPTQYSGGKHMRDLAGFDVERATGADGRDYTHAGGVELTDQTRFRQERHIEWTDTNVTPGATYRYRVIAYTLDHYRSQPGGPVTVDYHPGPETAPPAPPETPAAPATPTVRPRRRPQ